MRRLKKKKKPTNAPEGDRKGPFFPSVQTKLAIGKADDAYEKEADSVADKVVNTGGETNSIQKKEGEEEQLQEKPLLQSISTLQKKQMPQEEEPVQKVAKEEEETLQQKGEEEEETLQQKGEEEEPVQKEEEEEAAQPKAEEEETLQKKGNGNLASAKTETSLKSSKGQGQLMDKSIRKEMEKGFGADFSNVKIHTDTVAENMSQELGAQAFTTGNDIYFNEGKYNPETKEGKHLLAHELTHTIQQSDEIQRAVIENTPEDLEAARFKGDFNLEEAHDDKKLIQNGHQGLYVSKIQKGLVDLGFALPQYGVDGIYGNETRNAVINFQENKGLNDIDGIVGDETMGTLDDIHKGKNLDTSCCVEGFRLPQRDIDFEINSHTISKMTFCATGNFKITSEANWVSPHSAKHYHIFILPDTPGDISKTNRRYDVGKSETQNFKINKSDCVFFKVMIKVIDPANSPNLKGKFSVF